MKKIFIIIAIIAIAVVVVKVTTSSSKIEFISDQVDELAMKRVEDKIKESLKNPNSLLINEVSKSYSVVDDNGKFRSCKDHQELKETLGKINNNKSYTIHYTIDYSAQNGFGGMNRKTLSAAITIYDKGDTITSNTPTVTFYKTRL